MTRLLRLPAALACALLLAASYAASPVQAVGIDAYQPTRNFTLPAGGDNSGGNVLFDALPDGRLLLLNGANVSVETAPKSGAFSSLGDIPGFSLMFWGPGFLAVSPDGTRAAAGSNAGGTIAVFETANPTNATIVTGDDFAGEWIDNRYLAIANGMSGPRVEILDTQTATMTPVITNIGGASAGVAIDAAGNLYTGNGYGYNTGGSSTGWIKAFAAADWQNALATNTPLNFETTGTPVADLLSAYPFGFDGSGNMFVGGADFFGGSNDKGYAALISADAIADALANPQATPPINGNSPASVLRKIASPQETLDSLQPPTWNYNAGTGELLLGYYQNGAVTAYAAVPEPATLLLMAGAGVVGLLVRRRSRCLVIALLVLTAAPAAVEASPYDAFDFSDVDYWVGTGSNRAALVVDFYYPTGNASYVWGYQWDGTATGEQMFRAIAGTTVLRERDGGPALGTFAGSDNRLYLRTSAFSGGLGNSIFGIGYDADGDGGSFVSGFEGDETGAATDSDDYYREGWFTGYWSYWISDPATPAWGYSGLGFSSRELTNGSWDGWSYVDFTTGESGTPAVPTPAQVPEPAAFALAASAALAMLTIRRRQR